VNTDIAGTPQLRVSSAAELDARTHAGELGARELVALLDHPSWSVRRAVVANLTSFGDVAIPLLCASLAGERSDETRVAATVDALVAVQGDVETRLLELENAQDPHVVTDVAQILGRRRSLRGVDTLIRLTAHTDDNVAVGAIEALGRVGSPRAVTALLACLESAQFFRVFPAIDVISRTGDPRVVQPLAKLLRDSRYAGEATRALGRTGDRMAILPLSELLGSTHDGTVRVASLALLELRDRHAELYGASALFEQTLRTVGSDAVVRRLEQCAGKASPGELVAMAMILGALGNSAATPLLERMLLGAPDVAHVAAQSLQQLARAPDGPHVAAALRRADAPGRRALLPLVKRFRDADVLVECLADRDAGVRALACDALSRIGNASAVPALFARLADDNARVVHAATGALQSLGSHETERLALSAVGSASSGERRAALRIIGYFGYASALAAVQGTLNDADARVREAAIHALAFLEHPEAQALLLELSRAPLASTRAAAMRALGDSPHPDDRFVSPLRGGLTDPDPWVRYYAAQSLGKLRVTSSTELLATLLSDPAGQVRVAAVEALSHLGSAPALAALCEAAQSRDADMQRAALFGLSLSGQALAHPLLFAACRGDDPATRLVAISALAVFSAPEVLSALITAARDDDEGVRSAALGLLSRRQEPDATDALVEILRTSPLKQPIAAALSQPAPHRVARIAAALQTADDEDAALLTSCLARLHTLEATGALLLALESPHGRTRKAAVSTLLAIGNRDALSLVARMAEADPDADVRRVASLYLAQ
jgi:HEAT repeat protein